MGKAGTDMFLRELDDAADTSDINHRRPVVLHIGRPFSQKSHERGRYKEDRR